MTALLESLGITNRQGVEMFIERLIDMLDRMDPDPEAEPNLGWPERWGRGEETTFIHSGDDREDDDEREPESAVF